MKPIIFLFGHRKQHGKDTCCDITQNLLNKLSIEYIRTSFARKLKQHCAERYDLNVEQMEFDSYKNSTPSHLNGLTVRNVLLKEGNFARSIWENTWTFSTYASIFKEFHHEILENDNTSKAKVALISDFRYPNEFDCFSSLYNKYITSPSNSERSNSEEPAVIKILVYREKGKFIADGSDDQLPDLDSNFWHETILNNVEDGNWYNNLVNQVEPIIMKYLTKYGVVNGFQIHKNQ